MDSKNRLDKNVAKAIGLDIENMDSIDFDDLVGMKFKLVHNSDYYEKTAFKTFMTTNDLKKAYNSIKEYNFNYKRYSAWKCWQWCWNVSKWYSL